MYPTNKLGSDVWLNDTEVSRGHSSRFATKDRTLITLVEIEGGSSATIAENRTSVWPYEEDRSGRPKTIGGA